MKNEYKRNPDGYMVSKRGIAISVPYHITEKGLYEDNRVGRVLGKMLASLQEKRVATELNKQVYKTMLEEMLNYDRNDEVTRDDWIEVGKDAKNTDKRSIELSKEIYSNLPANIKSRIKKRPEGMRYIAVRRDLIYMYFGFREQSLLNRKIKTKNGTVKFKDMIGTLPYGEGIVNALQLSTDIWNDIVSRQKVNLIIKSPLTLWNNIKSNWLFSIVVGKNPITTTKNSYRYYKRTKEYLDDKKKLHELRYK